MFKDDLNKFIVALAKMRELAEYFPDGYDFGIDEHDPVVYDIIEISAASESFRDVVDSEPFMSALFRGMKRHITLQTRNALIDLLESILPRAKRRHVSLIRQARRTLEDAAVDPAIIGVVWQLYVQDLFDKAYSRAEKIDLFTNEATTLFERLLKKTEAHLIDRLTTRGNDTVSYIEHMLEKSAVVDIEPQRLDRYIEVLSRIPGHYAARLLAEISFVSDRLFEQILTTCKQTEQLDYLKIYFLNKLERSDTGFQDRLACHRFLTTVNDPQALRFLREELLYWDFWADHPQRKRVRTALQFYSQLFRWMIELNDRRAIPVFIKLLFEGEKMGYHREVLEIADDLLANTPWHAEIKQGVYLLKEGEMVFVGKNTDANVQISEKLKKYSTLIRRLDGRPPNKADLRKKISYDTRRWNGAYHEDLDGLRPIDLPEPDIKYQLLESMMIDFERKVRQRRASHKKALRMLPKFQGNWLTRPHAALGGKIPIAIIMHETEALATTRAQKEHFRRYKQETINGLYLEAASHFDANEHRDAERKLNTVLALDPTYPFARRLKKQLMRSF